MSLTEHGANPFYKKIAGIKYGAMNHPGKNPSDEVLSIADQGFNYCDFTYESKGQIGKSTADEIKELIRERRGYRGFEFVGHTAYYIPIAIDFPELVQASITAFSKSIEGLINLDIKKVTIHHDPGSGFIASKERIMNHVYVLSQLSTLFARSGVTIMLENSPFGQNQSKEIKEILDEVPDVMVHLDIAHALITGGMAEIEAFLELGQTRRLKHVHISDNNGINDDHLPIGVPHKKVHDWPQIIKLLKTSGYGTQDFGDTITLEVFAPDRENRVRSRESIKEYWADA